MTIGKRMRSAIIRIGKMLAPALFWILLSSATAQTTTVTYGMMASAQELPGWMAQVEAANELLAEKDIRIEVQQIPVPGWPEYYQRIVAQIAARRAPDIGRIAESFMPVVVNNEHVVDLTEYIEGLDISQYFEAAFHASAYRDGRYYGFPSGTYNMLLYFNKDMFDEAGVPYPSADWEDAVTFDQVRRYAQQLTHGDGANKQWGFAAGPYMAFIGMYALSNGGENVFNEDGSCALAEPESLEVYEWFDNMLRVDETMPTPTDTSVISAFEMYRSGRLAMMVDGTWFLRPVTEITNFQPGIAAVPSGSGEAYSSQFVDAWVVWRGTDDPDAAWEAIKALNSEEALDALAANSVGGIPVHRGTFQEYGLAMLGNRFDETDREAFTGALENGLAVPYNEHYQEIDSQVNANLDQWLLGRISYAEFAERVCQIVEETQAER